jgi:hypothetical protein
MLKEYLRCRKRHAAAIQLPDYEPVAASKHAGEDAG